MLKGDENTNIDRKENEKDEKRARMNEKKKTLTTHFYDA